MSGIKWLVLLIFFGIVLSQLPHEDGQQREVIFPCRAKRHRPCVERHYSSNSGVLR